MTEAEWKKVRGRKGYLWRPFRNGKVIRHDALGYWYMEVPRGDEDRPAVDWWGPWKIGRQSEEQVLGRLGEWHRRLERAGWFRMKADPETGSWTERSGLDKVLAKLRRSPVIPRYFLQSLDLQQAAAGKARSQCGRSVHVGGIDVQLWPHGEEFARLPDSMVRLAVTPPGVKPAYNGETVSMTLDAAQLDALIEFLVEQRQRLISYDTYQALWRHVDLTGGEISDENPPTERCRKMAETALDLDHLVRGLLAQPGLIPVIAGLVEVLAQGDRLVGVTIEAGDGQPHELNVMASSETALARSSGVAEMLARLVAGEDEAGPTRH